MDSNRPRIVNIGNQSFMGIHNRVHPITGINENGHYILGQPIGRIENNQISLNNGDRYRMYTLGGHEFAERIDPRREVESRHSMISEGEASSDDEMSSSDEERQTHVKERKQEEERQKRTREKYEKLKADREERKRKSEARKREQELERERKRELERERKQELERERKQKTGKNASETVKEEAENNEHEDSEGEEEKENDRKKYKPNDHSLKLPEKEPTSSSAPTSTMSFQEYLKQENVKEDQSATIENLSSKNEDAIKTVRDEAELNSVKSDLGDLEEL